ncbi:hypothetical protein BDR06DRAFT_891486 [Suillus hirtellus]|nr:hypothetical protein BDR06DRAFT_891486 [Suillus hirtellus]
MKCLHCTLIGKAHTMHTVYGVPMNYWDKFILTMCYFTNHTPVTLQDGHTSYECWFGTKPDLTHLCEIGCCMFVLIQNHNNPKVYNCSLECVLAYYCYHHEFLS